MKFNTTSLLLALVTLVSMTVVGCGGGSPDGRYPVSGSIKFGGSPMDHGRISFQPVDENGNSSSASAVKAGKYACEGTKTLLPGEYTVVITCEEPSGETDSYTDEQGKTYSAPKLVSYVPAEWGQRSTHTITIKAGKNHYDFDIPRESAPVAPPEASDGKTSGGA